MKSCLSLWIYGWLGKISRNIITWKSRFLQSFKYGRHTDADYGQGKKVCKDFEIKNLGEYYDLYVQSDNCC